MMFTAMLVGIALSGAGPAAVSKGGWKTGNDLLRECKEPVTGRVACISYIQGVLDAGGAIGVGDGLTPVIEPAGVTGGQLGDIMVAYLEKHPEQRHFVASQLVFIALHIAFDTPK